jgi:hypothetical protein
MEHSGGSDDHVDVVAVAGGCLDHPSAIRERAPDHRVAEPDVLDDTVFLGDLLEVSADLGTGREVSAPFWR